MPRLSNTNECFVLLIFIEGPQHLQQVEQLGVQAGAGLCEALHPGNRSGTLLPQQGQVITACC